MNTLNIYPFCEALATGLLYSLWLFPVLAAGGWLTARLLTHSKHRYLAYLFTLLACLTGFLAVVGERWWSVTQRYQDATFLEAEIGAPLATQLTDGFSKLGLSGAADWRFYITLAYAGGLLLVLARCGYRYWASVRMRRGGLLPEPAYRQLFGRLRRQVLPGRRVDWRITDRVRHVLVTGVLRPVILFPVGLINQLTEAEVAAVLRHELTHLQRFDPFWNAVQELVRALFFYHPVVYWLCRQLDREREYACDDAVLRHTEPTTYARALLRVAQYSLPPKTPFTMAATSSPDFTQRVQRLFSPAARPGFSLAGRPHWLSPLLVLPLVVLLAYTLANPYELSAQTPVAGASQAQEVVLTGTVTDGETGMPLIGTAIVIEDGRKIGTVTDIDGNYELRVPTGWVSLAVSYVGYQTANISVQAAKNGSVDIKLFKDKLAEIEVNDDAKAMRLDRRASDQAGSANAQDKTADEKLKIRGLPFTSNDKIVYLVNGKKRSDDETNLLDPATIESIEVIKNKETIKKMGYDSEIEGIIKITTKKG